MPYKKKYNKKYSRMRKYGRYARTGLQVANTALSVALKTKKLLNVEHKFLDLSLNSQSVSATGLGNNIVNMAQGDTASTRTGDQIKVTSIQFKYYLNINASATVSTVRVILVLDRQANGAGINLSQLLQDTTAGLMLMSPLNLDNKYRFKIMYNRIHQMSINGNRAVRGQYFKKHQIKIRYGSNAGTIADLTSRNLILFFISDEATNQPLVDCFLRVRFVDN